MGWTDLLRHGAYGVDWEAVTGLAAWTSIVVAVVAGHGLAAGLPVGLARGLVLGCLGVAWVLTLAAAWFRFLGASTHGVPSRTTRLWRLAGGAWLAAAMLLACARGAAATVSATGSQGSLPVAAAGTPPWLEHDRGVPTGVRTFIVHAASTPGGRCELLVSMAPDLSTDARSYPALAAGRLLLMVPPEFCPRGRSDRIVVPVSELRLRFAATLPGNPSPLGRARGAGAEQAASSEVVWLDEVGHGSLAAWSRGVARLRHAAWDASRGDDAAAFVVASSLGLRRALPPARRSALRAAGLGHLVAVSGLHVAIAAWLVARPMLRLGTAVGGGVWWGAAASWVFVAVYVMVTGSPPSAVRAGLMASAAGLGDALGRPSDGLVLLAASSAVMLLFRPAWAADPGFQLSVVAMAVLVRGPTGAGALRTTWRVTWAVVPVALVHFGRAGAYAVVSNLVAVPVVAMWTMPLGLVGALLVPWFGPAALAPAAWGGRLVLDVAHVVAQWPPVSAAALGIVASLSLVGSIALGVRAQRTRTRPRWAAALHAMLVPPVAAVATLVCVLMPEPKREAVPPMRWAAVGVPQRFAVLATGARAGRVCITGSVLSGSRWPALLGALGVTGVSRLGPGPRASLQSPHILEARGALRRAGLLGEPGEMCPSPALADVRAAVRHCYRLSGPGRATALVDTAGALHCFVAGSFRGPLSWHAVD